MLLLQVVGLQHEEVDDGERGRRLMARHGPRRAVAGRSRGTSLSDPCKVTKCKAVWGPSSTVLALIGPKDTCSPGQRAWVWKNGFWGRLYSVNPPRQLPANKAVLNLGWPSFALLDTRTWYTPNSQYVATAIMSQDTGLWSVRRPREVSYRHGYPLPLLARASDMRPLHNPTVQHTY